jgi:hypothetical protein
MCPGPAAERGHAPPAGVAPALDRGLLWVHKSRVRPVFTRTIRVPLIEGTGELKLVTPD